MARAKAKPKPKKKSAPKKKVTLEVIHEDMKKIHQKLDNLERELLAVRGATRSQTPRSKEEDEADIQVRFGFLTSI